MLNSRVFYDIKRGTAEARMILLHELGHYYNKDISGGKCTDRKEREYLATNGYVSQAELCADAFAVEYLGADMVISGLTSLIARILHDYEDYEEESLAIPIAELKARIAILQDNRSCGGNL